MVENGTTTSTFYKMLFSTAEPISVLENGSYYWLVSAYNSSYVYIVSNKDRYVRSSGNDAFGVRVLISLLPDVQVEYGTEYGSADNPWKIVE